MIDVHMECLPVNSLGKRFAVGSGDRFLSNQFINNRFICNFQGSILFHETTIKTTDSKNLSFFFVINIK